MGADLAKDQFVYEWKCGVLRKNCWDFLFLWLYDKSGKVIFQLFHFKYCSSTSPDSNFICVSL